MKNRIVTLLAVAAASSIASAQLIVGNDQSGTVSIWNIDVNSGAATAIYTASDSTAKPWGMAYAPGSNTLYWNNGGNLYSSPFSGALTPSAPLPMTFNGSTVNFVSLAWQDGKLLGTRNIATEAVYEINPATGVATQLYVYSSTFDFGGTDVDQTTGELYGVSDLGGAGLYNIDVAGATQSFITGYPSGETDIDGLAAHGGLAYLVTDGPNSTQANFYVVDIASGSIVGTLPSPFTGSGVFSAATFVPAPGAIAALGLGGFALARRRR